MKTLYDILVILHIYAFRLQGQRSRTLPKEKNKKITVSYHGAARDLLAPHSLYRKEEDEGGGDRKEDDDGICQTGELF